MKWLDSRDGHNTRVVTGILSRVQFNGDIHMDGKVGLRDMQLDDENPCRRARRKKAFSRAGYDSQKGGLEDSH